MGNKCPLCEGEIRNKRCTFCGMPYYGEDKTVREYNNTAKKEAVKRIKQVPKKPVSNTYNAKNLKNLKRLKEKKKPGNPFFRVIKIIILIWIIMGILNNIFEESFQPLTDYGTTIEEEIWIDEAEEDMEEIEVSEEILEEAVYKKLTGEDFSWTLDEFQEGVYKVRIYEGNVAIKIDSYEKERQMILLDESNNEQIIELFENDTVILEYADENERCVEFYQIG